MVCQNENDQLMISRLTDSFKDTLVLYQDSIYSIEAYINENTGNPAIAVIKGAHIDLPVIYWDKNNEVGFDKPELLSEMIKAKVRSYAYNMDRKIDL